MSKDKDKDKGGAAPTLADLLKDSSLEEIFEANKELKAEYDRKVSKGIETYKAAHPPKQDPPKPEPPKPADPPKGDEMPAWAKAMEDKMNQALAAIESKKKQELAAKTLDGNEKLKGLPQSLINNYRSRLSAAKAEEQENVIAEIEAEAEEIKSSFAKEDKGLPLGGKPDKKDKVTEDDVRRIMNY